MKIRTGFVSNSSSSSFVVAFPVLPKTKDELKTMLFGGERFYSNPYPCKGRPNGWTTDEVAETVWRDLQANGTLTPGEASAECMDGYIPGADYPQFPWSSKKEDWDAVQAERDTINENAANAFLGNVPKEHVMVRFTYSDNDGEYFSALEHGTLFDRLQHIRISHH